MNFYLKCFSQVKIRSWPRRTSSVIFDRCFMAVQSLKARKEDTQEKLERVERKEKIPTSMWLNKEGLINHPNKHRWTDSERCLVCIR